LGYVNNIQAIEVKMRIVLSGVVTKLEYWRADIGREADDQLGLVKQV
jgi:hypothetical protein